MQKLPTISSFLSRSAIIKAIHLNPLHKEERMNQKALLYLSWFLSVAVTGMLAMSGIMKLMGGDDLAKGFEHVGVPVEYAVLLAVLELSAAVIYLIPWTSVIGAILITGYMGGAILTHLRIHEPVFIQAALATVAWLGIWLRSEGLRQVLPLLRK